MYDIGHRITKLDSQLGAAGRAENWLLTPRAARQAAHLETACRFHARKAFCSHPSAKGPYRVLTLFYGVGNDIRRPEYGPGVAIKTRTVDSSDFFKDFKGWKRWARKKYGGFDVDKLPLHARVWYPDGPGPFPLALIVHGNHNMAKFSDPGYAYLGELLASRGIILASIDENFLNVGLFHDPPKQQAVRGWMLLEHLKLWHEWNVAARNPFHGKVDLGRDRPYLSDRDLEQLSSTLRVELAGLPRELEAIESNARRADPNNPLYRYTRARGLTFLRRRLNDISHVRFCIGGHRSGYAGRYPGVIEEAFLAVTNNKPLYLAGILGGATNQVVDAVEGRKMGDDFCRPSLLESVYAAPPARETDNATGADRVIDRTAVWNAFRETGRERLAQNNGLTVDENNELFHTSVVERAIELVLIGLSRLRHFQNSRRSSN